MEQPPQFNFIDVLRAPAKALSAKKIFVMTFFICLGLVVYDIFTYIALAIDGERLSYVWSVYGMAPFYKYVYGNIIAQIVFGVGAALAVLVVMMGIFGVASMDIESIRGNRFFGPFKAIGFSFRRLGQIFLSEFAIVVFLIFVVILFAIFGLICRIPVIGSWIYAVFFVVPGFVIAIFTVFIFFVLTLSVVLLPAVSATERHGEAFTSILETFSTIIRQPVRWGIYTAYTLVAAKIFSFVYAYFCFRSVQFIGWASKFGGGEKMDHLIRSGLSHLPMKSDLARETFNFFPGIDWGVELARWSRGGGEEAVGHLMAFMLFLIFASILGYFMATIAVGQARAYVAIRYIKDDYSIPDEKPLFFEDENVNPPIDSPGDDAI
ncbi:MAG: hypothetical protein JSU74_10515 [Candidatus Zixiibacteriota bacterium]|nr:MAG: hypothetical protein JSU74_10515 [candidate division Zixibacteria bacterium]